MILALAQKMPPQKDINVAHDYNILPGLPIVLLWHHYQVIVIGLVDVPEFGLLRSW